MPFKPAPHLVDTFVVVEVRNPPTRSFSRRPILPSVTISREAGAKGNSVASALYERLEAHRPAHQPPWVLFNQNLMEEILRAHRLPTTLARFFPEARPDEWRCAIESLLSDRPDPWTVFEHTRATIRRILTAGHAIVVGRGAHLIGADLPHALHFRLYGSPEQRLAHLLRRSGGRPAVMKAWMEKTDHDRRAYVRQYFDRDLTNPADYTSLLNTDHLSPETIAASLEPMIHAAARVSAS